MKKITFDVVFKIVVLLLLSIILIICFEISESKSDSSYYQPEPTEVGRYKEIKVKKTGFGGEREEVLILDTKTGETRSTQ